MVFLARNPDPPEAPAVLPCRLPPCSRPVRSVPPCAAPHPPRTPALSRPCSRLSLSLRPAVPPCFAPSRICCPRPRVEPAASLAPPSLRPASPRRSRDTPAPSHSVQPCARPCPPVSYSPRTPALSRPCPVQSSSASPCQAFVRPRLAVRPAPPILSHQPSHPARPARPVPALSHPPPHPARPARPAVPPRICYRPRPSPPSIPPQHSAHF